MGDAGHKWYILFICKYAYMCLYIFHAKLNIFPYIMSKKIEPNILTEAMVISGEIFFVYIIFNFSHGSYIAFIIR